MTKDININANGQTFYAKEGHTILEAALTADIPFPHSCRVGGCGTCKCRLTRGQVKELTLTDYLLTKEELDGGYILACQSIPLSDVSVDYVVSPDAPQFPVKTCEGIISDIQPLTPDISEVSVTLNEPLPYQGGQYALLSLPGIEKPRSYSFASKPSTDLRSIKFFIRKVQGGQFSNKITAPDMLGKKITVSGPFGDFWLRTANDPILFIAGGSGLSATLAILEEALAKKIDRPVTLLFAAKSTDHLYYQDHIKHIAKAWPNRFHYAPVLSKSDDSSEALKGHVQDFLKDWCEPSSHTYLCGSPGLVDDCRATLLDLDIPSSRVYTDRFISREDPAKPQVRAAKTKTASPFDYLKYFAMHVTALLCTYALLKGAESITYALIAFLLVFTLGDSLSGADNSTLKFRRPKVLTWILWAALPCLVIYMFAFVWSMSPGDPLGFGSWLGSLTSYDFILAKSATTITQKIFGIILSGLLIGLLGTITAHELTHRTWDKISMTLGRWLLAFSFDTIFAIEHVYGHHRYIGSDIDPATAPRGRSVYAHIIISTIKGNLSAWHIETERLKKRNLPQLSLKNAVIRGHLMSLFLVGIAYLIGGIDAAVCFTLAGLWGKALLEVVNYMEHYGIVRDLSTPVDPRHSWNSTKRLSSWVTFNLTRHSHHHAQGEVPFQSLRPYPHAPEMISGYLATIILTLIPPLWERLMAPKLQDWDQRYASPTERSLIAKMLSSH